MNDQNCLKRQVQIGRLRGLEITEGGAGC